MCGAATSFFSEPNDPAGHDDKAIVIGAALALSSARSAMSS